MSPGRFAPATGVPQDSNRAVLGVALLFVICGLSTGVFGGSLPGLKAHLSLGGTDVVGLLVAAAVCSVLAMNVSGPLADRVGAAVPALLGGVVLAVGVAIMGAATDYRVLLGGAAVFGVGNGTIDVAMNALGVSVERTRRRPVMSRLHAFFSIGNLLGALLVVVTGRLAPAGLAPRWSLWGGALVVVVMLAVLRTRTPQSPPRSSGDRRPDASTVSPDTGGQHGRGPLPRVIWLLAGMAICFGLTEGTAVDWSSLHVTEVARVSPSSGAWGLACVSGFMVVIRLGGDFVVARLGRAAVVQGGSVCALLGYVLTVFAVGLPLILLGWCLVGFGVGLVAPQIYGLTGHVGGGRGLARVVSFGYGAFLVGPAMIGFVASHSDLQRAMIVPMVSAVGLIVMSVRLPADPEQASA